MLLAGGEGPRGPENPLQSPIPLPAQNQTSLPETVYQVLGVPSGGYLRQVGPVHQMRQPGTRNGSAPGELPGRTPSLCQLPRPTRCDGGDLPPTSQSQQGHGPDHPPRPSYDSPDQSSERETSPTPPPETNQKAPGMHRTGTPPTAIAPAPAPAPATRGKAGPLC